MDWQTLKFDWNRARAFLATAEEGSLSAAAKALDMSQPTLSRQVTALEEELGAILFERVGRGLTMTPTGLELLAYVKAMGEAASSLSLAATGRATSIEGEIIISASEVTAAYILPSILESLQQQYPGIQVSMVASNSASDLRRREADIAIRNFRPTEPNLIARKLGEFAATLYATPGYLKSLGNPLTPLELAHASFIGFSSGNEAFIQALNAHDIPLQDSNFAARSDSHVVQWEMVKRGIGIGVMPVELGHAEPKVKRVLPETLFRGDVWLASHRELRTNLRVRIVYDFLANALACHFDKARSFW
ncbi:LysR family transcriptional regulator [Alcanivorax sediminis]|uniref:LysR family transcriptional regulator n=1 Tax=Alcanivorax sediminis TaxID=2663008 RepID=A0A6N7LSF7_9GAMM|nr:LysR family transcriptional regulator [Alcanivorax sediminis]MQX51945.1 LysR family transcriptional regulator [Alcanivorax sediminis]